MAAGTDVLDDVTVVVDNEPAAVIDDAAGVADPPVQPDPAPAADPPEQNLKAERDRLQGRVRDLDTEVKTLREQSEQTKGAVDFIDKLKEGLAGRETPEAEEDAIPDPVTEPEKFQEWAKDVKSGATTAVTEERTRQESAVREDTRTGESRSAIDEFIQEHPDFAPEDADATFIHSSVNDAMQRLHVDLMATGRSIDKYDIQRAIDSNPAAAALYKTSQARASENRTVSTLHRAGQQATRPQTQGRAADSNEIQNMTPAQLAEFYSNSDEGVKDQILDIADGLGRLGDLTWAE